MGGFVGIALATIVTAGISAMVVAGVYGNAEMTEAARTAGLSSTKSMSAASDWAGTRLVAPKLGRCGGTDGLRAPAVAGACSNDAVVTMRARGSAGRGACAATPSQGPRSSRR